MIRVKVKFFGPFRELFGGREMEIDLPAGVRLSDLLRRLSDTEEKRGHLFSDPDTLHPHVVIMRNGAPAHGPGGLGSLIRDGDIIAVFPLMGGG